MKSGNQTKEDQLLLARMEDKQRLAEERYMITAGHFLDAHQRKVAEAFLRSGGAGSGSVRVLFYGGYPQAERCMPVFLPDFAAAEDYDAEADLEELIRVVRVSAGKASNRRLTHRDYLGSLLALGLDREVTGDILVRDESSALGSGADIIVEADIADFIQLNYEKAGRTSLTAEVLPVSELHIEPARIETHHDTVASLRLDSVAASAFRLSRAKAAEAIRRGLVSVNSVEVLKIDAEVEEGDRIVLRGQGKVVLSEVGGSTRKDRIRITIDAYR